MILISKLSLKIQTFSLVVWEIIALLNSEQKLSLRCTYTIMQLCNLARTLVSWSYEHSQLNNQVLAPLSVSTCAFKVRHYRNQQINSLDEKSDTGVPENAKNSDTPELRKKGKRNVQGVPQSQTAQSVNLTRIYWHIINIKYNNNHKMSSLTKVYIMF